MFSGGYCLEPRKSRGATEATKIVFSLVQRPYMMNDGVQFGQPAEINSVDKIVRVARRITIRVGIGLGESWS